MSDVYRVADYVSEFLSKRGIKHVFMLPGGGAMFLNDGIAKNKMIEAVPCLHEQACAIAAEAYSRINGNLGVAMVTTGPGATNAITGVAGAWIESVPMIVISGQVKRSDLLKDSPLRQRGVQEVDIVSMVKSVTKYARTLQTVEEVPAEFEKAFNLAVSGRAGPVWIDIPLDIQAAPIDQRPVDYKKTTSPQTHLESDQIKHIKELLKNAKRPLILAGHGVRLSGAAEDFRKVIEKLKIPVVATWNAMDLLPYNHDLYVGRPGVVALRGPNFAVQNCDLLISIGSRLDNIITAFNPKGFARGAKKIVVDIDQNEIDKLDMEIDLKICDDARGFINILSACDPSNYSEWVDHCNSWKKKYSEEKSHLIVTDKINHAQFVKALSEEAPANTLISTGSSGLAVEFFYTLFKNKPGQRIFLTSGLGSMGYGLPAAIGSCFSNDQKPMLAIESDGSLQLNIQELATLKSFNLPIKLIIMNNNGYASIRNTQRNYFASRFIGTGPEARLWMPDLEKVAATYGIPFMRISDPKQLNKELQKVMEATGPMIVDVQLENNETLAPKVSAIPHKDGSMTSMPLEDMSPLLSLEELRKEMIVDLHPSSESARST